MAKKKEHGYTPRERCIFRFWDGERERAVDPLAVRERLASFKVDDFNLEIDMKLATSDTPEAAKSVARLIAAIRYAFQVEAFGELDGKEVGLTIKECLELLAEFGRFVQDLKKKQPNSRSSAKPTASPDPSTTAATSAST